jgi:hypothetical protein
MDQLTESQIDYFKSKIAEPDENGCMFYLGSHDRDGYGRVGFTIDNKYHKFGAHRLVLFLSTGTLPIDLHACHDPVKCKSRACCNPDHLRWDTNQNNTRDRIITNTNPIGERHNLSKLTEKQVLEIRSNVGNTYQQIADIYGVARVTIEKIRNRKTWTHI